MMVDNGNVTVQGVAIKSSFHKKIGAGFYTKQISSIGTANESGRLTTLGISNPIELRIGQWTFRAQPLVVAELSDNVNLGNGFLQKIGCRLSFRRNGTFFTRQITFLALVRAVRGVTEITISTARLNNAPTGIMQKGVCMTT